MSKTQKIGKLSPSEDAVAKRVLLGKEEILKFANAEDAIKHLHTTRLKRQKTRHQK
jgi:hypothetical protein